LVRTEGSLYAEWTKDLGWVQEFTYIGFPANTWYHSDVWNRLGIVNSGTTVTEDTYRIGRSLSDDSFREDMLTIRGNFVAQANRNADPNIFNNMSVIELGGRPNDGTALLADVGPGYDGTLIFAHQWGDEHDDFRASRYKSIAVSTSKLMAPKNVNVTVQDEGSGNFRVAVKFEKGTAYPAEMVTHIIFRKKVGSNDYVLAGTLSGDETQYSEAMPTVEGEYEYFVQSDLNDTWRGNFGLNGIPLDSYSEAKVKAT